MFAELALKLDLDLGYLDALMSRNIVRKTEIAAMIKQISSGKLLTTESNLDLSLAW